MRMASFGRGIAGLILSAMLLAALAGCADYADYADYAASEYAFAAYLARLGQCRVMTAPDGEVYLRNPTTGHRITAA